MEQIRVSRQGLIESITVTGELDRSNVGALDEALRSALYGTTTSCLLDLSQLTFMDSSVVHTGAVVEGGTGERTKGPSDD